MRMQTFLGATMCAAGAIIASPTPAAADYCELSWDVPCCPIPGTNIGKADVALTICNCTDQPTEYRFQMKSGDPGVQFDPPMGMISLQPGQCIDIPITVYCPPGLPPGEGFTFSANVINLATGGQFECTGLVKGVQDFKVTPVDPVIVVPIPDPTDPPVIVIPFLGTNMGGGLDPLSLSFETMGPILPPSPMQFLIPPGDTQGLELMLQAVVMPPESAAPGPPTTATLLVKWDDDGDGIAEVNSSVNLRFEFGAGGCVADLNSDGRVDGADLANLLANWGMCP